MPVPRTRAGVFSFPAAVVGQLNAQGSPYPGLSSSVDAGTGAVTYQWWLSPAKVGGSDPGASYLVTIYPTAARALRGNAAERRRDQRGQGGNLLPALQPSPRLLGTQWLNHEVDSPGHCAVLGGMAWRNLAFWVYVYDDNVREGACVAWASRTQALLLERARRYAGRPDAP